MPSYLDEGDGNVNVNISSSSVNTNRNTNDDRELDDDELVAQSWGSIFREFRHSSCMIRPVSLVMLFTLVVFFVVTSIFQFPGFILGLIMAPILKRNAWYVEFLYPLPLGRWGHFLLMSFTAKMRHKVKDKNQGFHSRTMEQKVEVVPGRIYIHFLPQWLDNIGYLVVFLPDPSNAPNALNAIPPIALIVDCGEFEAVIRSLELIQKYHYSNLPKIQLQSILSTHKHHDHTGGNAQLLKHPVGKNIHNVFGGAVEKVPCCTDFLADGEILQLPRFETSNMNELIEIEAIAVPAHTRGSLVYRLRSKVGEQAEYMFTGDTMFSGGGGVPFEADVGIESDKQLRRSNGHTHIRPTIGALAMERCFTELISRAKPNNFSSQVGERILIFPGHEYTQELLTRQFQSMVDEHNKWRNFSPRDYFETVSHMYVALHRRSLPHNSGRLLIVPSTLSREVHINTYMRSLRRSANLVVRALSFWHDNFCTTKSVNSRSPHGTRIAMNGLTRLSETHNQQSTQELAPLPTKTSSGSKKWNLDAKTVNNRVFTTVYTADLKALIDDLSCGKVKKEKALEELHEMIQKMETPVVNKRAIPGFLPSDKNIYRGICGLAILGSKPCGLTISDSRKLKLPLPMDYNSDKILVSMKRLVLVLTRLGFPETSDGEDIYLIIKKLWIEANEYYKPKERGKGYNSVDIEASGWRDQIELGMLKWLMYGVSANQPTWFSKVFCMPCSPGTYKNNIVYPEHPASTMSKKPGDLVSHDIIKCNLCKDATGNVQLQIKSNGTSSFDSSSANGGARLSLKETESGETGLIGINPEIEISQAILQATGEHNKYFPT